VDLYSSNESNLGNICGGAELEPIFQIEKKKRKKINKNPKTVEFEKSKNRKINFFF
jgi:hypothetical protein